MPKQQVPDIAFGSFVLSEIPKLFKDEQIHINKQYQRGDIWRYSQKIELIKSIMSSYSIGVLVLFINDEKKFEILDGQQRLLTINQYLNDRLDLKDSDLTKYSDLDFKQKTLLDAYCVYYLKLKSHDPESKEEDVIQTFLRLQEGTPLNKAEKISAYRGKFKDTFVRIREEHKLFTHLGKEKRFRFRQLCAELMALELEGDFSGNYRFPNIDLKSMISIIKKYEKNIDDKKMKFFVGTLDMLERSLGGFLTGFTPREVMAFYLLLSYLRKIKSGNKDLINEFSVFAEDFLKDLNSFSIYDDNPPQGMSKELFDKYKKYKLEAKVMTTGDSIRNRFIIILEQYERMYSIIAKDTNRLFEHEQKRELFFRQKGKCIVCNKDLDFWKTSAHHVIEHSSGGKTDVNNAKLLHEKCHEKIHKSKTT